jgi:hypothetical protein
MPLRLGKLDAAMTWKLGFAARSALLSSSLLEDIHHQSIASRAATWIDRINDG